MLAQFRMRIVVRDLLFTMSLVACGGRTALSVGGGASGSPSGGASESPSGGAGSSNAHTLGRVSSSSSTRSTFATGFGTTVSGGTTIFTAPRGTTTSTTCGTLEPCPPGYACVIDTPPPGACSTCQCIPLGPAVCIYRANTYSPGATFPRGDFCNNTCSCLGDGGVECTQQSCAGGCAYNGWTYANGEVLLCKECNQCICLAPDIAVLTNTVCGAPPQTCQLPSDCTGVLPSLCIPCSDGGQGCAHFECDGGVCVDGYCD
jgi:hypothetical protein